MASIETLKNHTPHQERSRQGVTSRRGRTAARPPAQAGQVARAVNIRSLREQVDSARQRLEHGLDVTGEGAWSDAKKAEIRDSIAALESAGKALRLISCVQPEMSIPLPIPTARVRRSS